MTYSVISNIACYQPIAENSSTQKHTLGFPVQAQDPTYGVSEFIYLKGVASTLVGSWVHYRADDWTTSLIVADAAGPVAVAMAATVANEYGWYQIYGKARAQAALNFADNADVYIATAGVADDAVVDGDMVHGAKGASTITTAGLAEFEINYPYTDNIATND